MADKTIVKQAADKRFSVVLQDASDYLHEVSRQLEDNNIFKDIKFSKNILVALVEKINRYLNVRPNVKLIPERELEYFTCNSENATNLGKLFFLPKINKSLSAIPVRPLIPSCGTLTTNFLNIQTFLNPLRGKAGPTLQTGNFLQKKKKKKYW